MCLVRWTADGVLFTAACRRAPPVVVRDGVGYESDDPRRFLPGPGAVTEYDLRWSRIFARHVLDALDDAERNPR